MVKPVVLRRTSWPVFFGVAILGIGIGMLAAVCKVTSVQGFRTGWQGIPVYLGLVGFIGRIANCKVVLRADVLLVINPLRTHLLPKRAIHGVSTADDGTLTVYLGGDRNVSVYAFGGSLIDHFRKTSGKAEHRISVWLHAESANCSAKMAPQIRWTRCTFADVSLVLCAVISGVGASWMAFSR